VRYRAIVYLQHASQKIAKRIGEIDVEPLPPEAPLKEDCYIKFMNEGRTELGRVSTIAPGDWYKTGATPTIHVVQSGGE
jgi:hypothetical protein